MALSERFGLGDNLILGVQGIPESETSVDFTVATLGLDVTDTNPAGGSQSADRTVVVSAQVGVAINTRRVIGTWTGDITSGTYSINVSRVHNGVPVVSLGSASGATGHTGGSFDNSQDYTDTNDEIIRLGLSWPAEVDNLRGRVFITTYNVTYVPVLTVDGVRFLKTGLDGERTAFVNVTSNGISHEIRLTFRDEALIERTFTGKLKKKVSQQ
jgi:hypothetical protein